MQGRVWARTGAPARCIESSSPLSTTRSNSPAPKPFASCVASIVRHSSSGLRRFAASIATSLKSMEVIEPQPAACISSPRVE